MIEQENPKPLLRELTNAERNLNEFDPAASPEERLFGYIIRGLIQSSRIDDAIKSFEKSRYTEELDDNEQTIKNLARVDEANNNFVSGMQHHYRQRYPEIFTDESSIQSIRFSAFDAYKRVVTAENANTDL